MNIFAWFRKREPVAEPAPQIVPQAEAPISKAQNQLESAVSTSRPRGGIGAVTQPCAPKVGMELTELRDRRRSPCVVARVQANGRRIVVRCLSSGLVRCFTLRPDGIYRLESAPVADGVSRLVFE
jgi:hypothetical protein